MGKMVIYTAVIGDYDTIHQPEVVDGRFDYVLFSDKISESQIGVWQVRPIHYINEIQTKIARWVKTHPEELLPEYDASVWMDASVIINSPQVYERIIELQDSKVLISTLANPDLVCIYQEMLSMMYLQWETENVTVEWGKFLRSEHYPRWIGTNETRILYREHSNTKVRDFDKLWWWCIENYSRRDQFSFHYVIWKHSIKWELFFPTNTNEDYSQYYHVLDHANSKNKYLGGCMESSHLLRYYRKHVDERPLIENVYFWIYGRKFPFFWLNVMGTIFRIKHSFLCRLGREDNCDYISEIKKMKDR